MLLTLIKELAVASMRPPAPTLPRLVDGVIVGLREINPARPMTALGRELPIMAKIWPSTLGLGVVQGQNPYDCNRCVLDLRKHGLIACGLVISLVKSILQQLAPPH